MSPKFPRFAFLATLFAGMHQLPAAIIAGNLVVVQNDTANTSASVSASFSYATPGISYVGGTRGDFGFRFDQATDAADRSNGIMMVSMSENGRSNQGTTIGSGLGFSTPAIQFDANIGSTWGGWGSSINIGNTAITGVSSGDEWNANQAVGYFKYTEFLGGLVTNGTHAASGGVNNGTMTSFASSSAGFTVGSGATDPGTFTVFDNTGDSGIYTLRLGGFTAPGTGVAATSQNGILLVTGGKNEDNYSLSRANADGTFTIITKDNGADSTTFENDPAGFVYIPLLQPSTVALGRIDAEGDTIIGSGSYTVAKGGVGQWYLSSPDRDPTNTILLISPEGVTTSSGTFSQDNIWSYQWDAANTRWVIEGRDIPSGATTDPALQNLAANEAAFSFLLIPEPSSCLLGLGGLLLALRRRVAR
jgi:hypothetical protein